eukprot:1159527-Pelagomonas_calceolata.AAC.1
MPRVVLRTLVHACKQVAKVNNLWREMLTFHPEETSQARLCPCLSSIVAGRMFISTDNSSINFPAYYKRARSPELQFWRTGFNHVSFVY